MGGSYVGSLGSKYIRGSSLVESFLGERCIELVRFRVEGL